ncbi:hypothetical protein [Singulisphaera sp. PoT]|uniref:hypothetical protein n=1 Tax=Singulisphaera sp. PoT TaxID=3411797 RepID=UPI003BF5521E
MSLAPSHDRLKLPESLEAQLLGFRKRVWSVKMLEAVAAAAFVVLISYLVMFGLDRVWDTPDWPRLALFAIGVLGCTLVPIAAYRWVWRNRHLEQLARLLSRKHPNVGDQLLGIIELVRDDSEQARSRALCEAAIRQVAEDAQHRDFRNAVPNPRHRTWAWVVAAPTALVMALFSFVPDAAANAWVRFIAPWQATARYTFAALQPIPKELYVAHGEPFAFTAKLTSKTAWKPKQGLAEIGQQHPVVGTLRDGRYTFDLPSQLQASNMVVRIGDSVHKVRVEPKLRPELTSVAADVTLPKYLGRPQPQSKDVRGGSISLVKGSQARISITASRELASGQVDGKKVQPEGASVTSPPAHVDGSKKIEFRWQDEFGLEGKEPFVLTITGRDDEAPSLIVEGLPRQKVVLDTEQLGFKVRAQDDFGIKRVGISWQGVEGAVVSAPAEGERALAAGGNDKENLEVDGTFSAKALGIEPQPVNVRVFTEDYLPGRGRVYSAAYMLYVLNAEQHAVWLTEQLSKWHRQSLEVRDREMQLFETNKQLRDLSAEELDRPDTRRKIESQSAAERANGRRLSGLVVSGEDLVKQAMRNPEFGVGHLERWAEMLQVLKDISGNRMPSVADLLKQAAQAPPQQMAANAKSKTGPMAGQSRSNPAGKPSETLPDPKKPETKIPLIADGESSQQPPDKNEDPKAASKKKPSSPSLRLPTTTLAGKSKPGEELPTPPANPDMEEAVKKQQDLLAEFEKISEELNKVLANLEGSTLVKRLKAASRLQANIAGKISDHVDGTFGLPSSRHAEKPLKTLGEMAQQEAKGSHDVSIIMDDMHAYFERRRFQKFKSVLDEMKAQDVIGNLRLLGDDLKRENGLAISQCEYWSDTLDRWAEDLVDPSNCGACPGSKSKASLPPSVVLEVLQILESEINLREETRVTEQARAAVTSEEYGKQANGLSTTQDSLRDRTEKVTQRIRELPDGEKEFPKEIQLLGQVAMVMKDAQGILAQPNTSGPAIAAETEAIELLLQSRRINPKGGGGGGASPGGGGTGDTKDSALTLVGTGTNQKEVREDHGISQATGDSGASLPEEFRAGLDEYFNRLDRAPGGQ